MDTGTLDDEVLLDSFGADLDSDVPIGSLEGKAAPPLEDGEDVPMGKEVVSKEI